MIDRLPVQDSDLDGRPFLSVVAHELRTPLTSVMGLFALLEDGTVKVSDAEARELAALGRSEAERMLLIIENLLAATKLAQGRLEPERLPVDLPGLVRDALDEFPEVGRRAFVPIDKRAVAVADRRLVSQIITNLVQNVARYAPAGEVEVRFEYRDGSVDLSVADDGPGVPAGCRDSVFSSTVSEKGLGVGLGISRDLARAMGGDLVVREESFRKGATFTLTLPLGKEGTVVMAAIDPALRNEDEAVFLSPSARILVDMTEILGDRSLDRLVAGLHKLFTDLLDAQAGLLVVRNRSGELKRAGSFGATRDEEVVETPIIKEIMSNGTEAFVADLAEEEPLWAGLLRSRSALFLPVHDDEDIIGVLVVGWDSEVEPSLRLLEIANALARLAAFGAHRAALAAEVLFERQMRSTVLQALPIAISIFAGDPPSVVDWNEAERRLLGIRSDEQRPSNLALSQEVFDVRFLDGTPLTMENSPVVQTIRAGKTMGPFMLRIRRADGTDVVARAYCAPFFENGAVAGAVVTSEEVEIAEGPGA